MPSDSYATLRPPLSRYLLTSLAVSIVACVGALGATETPVNLSEVRDRVLYQPKKEYYRAWETDASCTVIMVVDPVSGKVTRDYIEGSTGNDYLNRLALEMLREWKFKPGSPHLIRTTFAFGAAAWRDREPTRQSQPLNKILEPFLGKDPLVKGSLPDYPRDKPWTNKHGTCVFDLSVDRAGRVTAVTVKKSSGDANFDQAMQRALRGWLFRRGPLEIELPLYFALTPQKFAVRIPKYP